ncbi:hypothetical protein QAD02_019003, partial [Eretmocerus hayati]
YNYYRIMKNVCTPLPVNISNRITTYEQRENYLLDFLRNVLPSCDVQDISDELRKTFTLNKHKPKVNKEKPKKFSYVTTRKGILLGLNKLGKTSLRYSDMLPLNSLWLGYMHHMLGIEDFKNLPLQPTNSNWENVNQRLIKADYHGAKITVIRSKCPSVIGIHGIVIQDTKNTFRLLGKDNVIRTVPKQSSVFRIHLDDVVLEVFGKEVCIRPTERSVKKFKSLHLPKL